MTVNQLNAYLALGLKVFPCRAVPETLSDGSVRKEKTPLTRAGFKDASSDPDQIAKWHAQFANCAWAVATSAEYAVVDIDPRHGGNETLAALISQHGPLPPCPTVLTGSGGTHYVLKFPPGTRNSEGRIGPGIDVRAEGGYVLVPPSRIHDPEGRHTLPYRWQAKPWEVDPPPAPDWLVELQMKDKPKAAPVRGQNLSAPAPASAATPFVMSGEADLFFHPGSPKGERRTTLLRLAGSALGSGADPDDVRVLVGYWAERCTPSFEREEWEPHLDGLLAKEEAKREAREAKREARGEQTQDAPVLPDTSKQPTNCLEPMGETVKAEPEGTGELVACLPPDVGEGECVSVQSPAEADPHTLHPLAYHGVLGEVVKAVSPHTEADDPALLVCLLTAFGSAVGQSPHFDHGKRHGANMFVGLVGPTASRKGTATGIAKSVLADADPVWLSRVQHEGFGSGEGLIWSVRDPSSADPVGIPDKRLLVIEEEWAKAFTLSANEKSILTPIIRNAYDRIPIGKRNKGENAYGCAFPHVSIIANITPDDLRQSLSGKHAVSIANGFVNRFLLVATRRTKFLPRGGKWKQHADPFTPVIRKALEVGRTRTLMELDGEAGVVWDDLFADLDTRTETLAGAATARASDNVMKLAMLYALADSDTAIRLPHLRAALAVWRYCEATAFGLFDKGTSVNAEPDPLWLQLHNAIIQTPGVSRSELTVSYRRVGNADAIGEALDKLKANGNAVPAYDANPNGGPKRERWYPAAPAGVAVSATPPASPINFTVQPD